MNKDNKINFIFAIPHFHYDVEWWKTEDGYNKDVEEILDAAFAMMEEFPEFTYVIDQALSLRPYWNKKPEMREKIRRWAHEGRLEFVGGMFCSPDENIPTGEALARQFVYGKRFFEEEAGSKSTTGWEIDTFGHPAQFAQILAKAGMNGFVFARGVQNWKDPDAPIHFFWQAPDGSRVLCNWFAAHYTAFSPLLPALLNYKSFKKEMEARIAHEGPRTAAEILMFPFGSDFSIPHRKWPKLVEIWNKESGNPKLQFSLPNRYFQKLEREAKGKAPTIAGEFNPLLTGCCESREKIKKLCRQTQHASADAEKWAACAWRRGLAAWPKERLDRAWELVLTNDFHDIVCGTGTDRVYRNALKRYAEAEKLIEEVGSISRQTLCALADTRGGGRAAVVFNSLNWRRNEVVTIPWGVAAPDGDRQGPFAVAGADGESIPCQPAAEGLLTLMDAPPMGFCAINIKKAKRPAAPETFVRADGLMAENEFLRIELDAKTGNLSSLFDKTLGREMLDKNRFQGGELLAEEDAGNLWTVQKTGRRWDGKRYSASIRLIESGPLRARFEVTGRHHGMGRVQQISLLAGSRRVDFESEIDFKGKDLRVKAMFASSFAGSLTCETPFYSQQRNPGHWCAQNWADLSDGQSGLAVFNAGNPGVEADERALGLVLFRSVSVFSPALLRYAAKNLPGIARSARRSIESQLKGLSTGEWELYEHHGLLLREWSSAGGPEMKGGWSAPDHLVPWLLWPRKSDAWERGRHTFRYAVCPHEGDWQTANLPRRGMEFNVPLAVENAKSEKGPLGRRASLFETGDDDALILTALKKAEKADALVARLYDASGKGGRAKFACPDAPIRSCKKTNLVEDAIEKSVRVRGGVASDSLTPWEIATFTMK